MAQNLNFVRQRVRERLLRLYKSANAGHIGSSLSCIEILVYLFFESMRTQDRLILSKGHAAGGLYAVLAEKGLISEGLLETFYKDGTYLAAHPPCSGAIEAIPFGTGSLGHGLSLASGLAFSTRFTGKDMNIYCVLSDGECDEGSTWEAALFAAHHRLSNLTIVIDANGLQGIGPTEQVMNLEPLVDKWKAFNFEVAVAKNGNSLTDLQAAHEQIRRIGSSKPACIIARTVKGSGISFMQNKMEWHYLPMNDSEFEQAINENAQRPE